MDSVALDIKVDVCLHERLRGMADIAFDAGSNTGLDTGRIVGGRRDVRRHLGGGLAEVVEALAGVGQCGGGVARKRNIEWGEAGVRDARCLYVGVDRRRSGALEGAVGGSGRVCRRRADRGGRWSGLDANVDLVVLQIIVSYDL